MGFSSRQPVHARYSLGADIRNDPRFAGGARLVGIIAAICFGLIAGSLRAETLRVATYNAELSASGPGLLLQSLRRGTDLKQAAVLEVIANIGADVLLINGIDYDLSQAALDTLAARLEKLGAHYPYRMALRPNTGLATGLDLDGNGRTGEPRDAQGYGRFAGEGGMAILSRLPIDRQAARNFNEFLWADLPDNLMPEGTTPAVRSLQRLSTTGHWDVPVQLPSGKVLHLLAWYGTPPIFDGPEDRNGRRNHDETAFWLRLLHGDLEVPAPEAPFILLGQSNLDPNDGDGLPDAMRALLADPVLQDPEPRANNSRVDPGQSGNPALDTAFYEGIGGLRVEVVLPSADLKITGSGVVWPDPDEPFAATLTIASRHRPVWVEIEMP